MTTIKPAKLQPSPVKPYVAEKDCTNVAPKHYSKTPPQELNCFGKFVAGAIAHVKTFGREDSLGTRFTESQFKELKGQEEVKLTKSMKEYGIFTQ